MSLRDHLQAIYDGRGELTPALVVDEARPEDHPLHNRFEWDDAKAGEAWRREQAAQLIRSVKIIYAKTRKGPKDVRAYTAVRGEQSHQANYMPTEEALADDFTRQLILRDMKREWQAFKRRYEHMAEFAELILSDLNKEAS